MTMRNALFVVAAGLSICLVATVASAGITSLTPSVIDNSAGGAPLANFVTNDVTIDFTGQYTGAQAWIQLSAGSIYQDAAGTKTPPVGAVVGAIPSLGFDSFVAQGSPTAGSADGEPSPGGGAVDLGAPAAAVFDSSTINQAWNPAGGQFIADKTGFLIGRFSLSDTAMGTANFLASAGGERSTYEFPIMNGVIGGEPPPTIDVMLNDLGEREWSDGVISAMAMSDKPADSWSDLTLMTGSPAIAATLDAQGNFSWDPAGSAAGKKGSGAVVYEWKATAHLGTASDTDTAFRVILIPEPATMSLFGLAMIACVGVLRRRG